MNEDDLIKKRMEAIFPSPEVAERVVRATLSNRPNGWSKRSQSPYYKEIYATAIKKDIDGMIKDGKRPLCYKYNVFCDESTGGMTPHTLYTRINQSIRYLIERMDPSHVYEKWYETVRVKREKGVGITISFITGMTWDGTAVLSGELIDGRENMPIWKRDMEDWLESDKAAPFFEKYNLALNPEEILELKQQFSTLTNIQCSITSDSVRLMRVG